jgi:tRNA pseudouridine38-40 synthase
MRILKLTLAYDGSRFVGWQRQAEGESIQGCVEEILARFEGGQIVVHGSGRTDAGVHALAQVASAEVTFAHDTGAVMRALNAQLPEAIRVLSVEDADADFHARFSARSKTYEYRIRHAPVADPFARAFEWHLGGRLDVGAMQRAADAVMGTHDFTAFRSVGTETATPVRTISLSEVAVDGPRLIYRVTGNGFLRHMVRTLVGTLVAVGRGWRPVEDMTALLQGAARGQAGATAPPHGLFLVRVDYD